MAVNIQPLADRVLVQSIDEKEVKKGGIIIPVDETGKLVIV